MTKQEFYDLEKETITAEYKQLKAQFKCRLKALEVLEKKYDYSVSTLKAIISNSAYRKSTKKVKQS